VDRALDIDQALGGKCRSEAIRGQRPPAAPRQQVRELRRKTVHCSSARPGLSGGLRRGHTILGDDMATMSTTAAGQAATTSTGTTTPATTLTYGAAPGLRFASVLDGNGGCKDLDWEGVRKWRAEDGVLWVHLERDDSAAQAWLQNDSGLD